MQTHTVEVFTSDNHRFQATLYPAGNKRAPVLVFLCALGTPARVYARFARELTQLGINVCVPDWRGIGSSSVRVDRGVDFGYRHLLEIDHPALLASVHQLYPESPIWLGGHSLGGQLSLLAASTASIPIDGVLLIASGTVHLPCYPIKLRASIRAVTLLARLSGTALGYFPGNRLGFGGREARGVMADWGNVAHKGNYEVAGSTVNYEQTLARMSTSIVALTFAADTWAPANATQTLIKKAQRSSLTHWHWGRTETQGHDLDHFSWLKHPNLIAPVIAERIINPLVANHSTDQRTSS